jgi:hypothetical protein
MISGKLFLFSRLSRPAGRSKRIFTKKAETIKAICNFAHGFIF